MEIPITMVQSGAVGGEKNIENVSFEANVTQLQLLSNEEVEEVLRFGRQSFSEYASNEEIDEALRLNEQLLDDDSVVQNILEGHSSESCTLIHDTWNGETLTLHSMGPLREDPTPGDIDQQCECPNTDIGIEDQQLPSLDIPLTLERRQSSNIERQQSSNLVVPFARTYHGHQHGDQSKERPSPHTRCQSPHPVSKKRRHRMNEAEILERYKPPFRFLPRRLRRGNYILRPRKHPCYFMGPEE
nr:MAG: hypothetical protein [Metapenaeus ensis nimavirus]